MRRSSLRRWAARYNAKAVKRKGVPLGMLARLLGGIRSGETALSFLRVPFYQVNSLHKAEAYCMGDMIALGSILGLILAVVVAELRVHQVPRELREYGGCSCRRIRMK